MPGKSTLPLSANKSKERTGSSTSDSKKRRDQDVQKILIWPEWTEAELGAEKWDIAGGKGKDKKTPLPGVLFEDPDGHVVMPSSLTPDCWKRPSEYLLDQTPNMVVSEDTVDLVTANEHLYNSATMLWIISQLTALWNVRVQLATGGLSQTVAAISSTNPSSMSGSDNNDASSSQFWKPWDHLYPQPKGQSLPSYNPAGKYCVRLYWMGYWRKVTVDDQLPFDSQDRLLLPSTTNSTELWPAILCKAILKIMSLDYAGGCEWSEYGEASPIQMLTGWLPHTITIRKDSAELWDKLSGWLPLWKRPQPETAIKQPDATNTPTAPLHNKHLDATLAAEGKPRSMEGKRHKGGSAHQLAVPANSGGAALQPVISSEMTRAIVLASYAQPPDWYPIQQSVKQDLAVVSDLLTENGLPVHLPHSVLLTQVRDEPLELPPKEPPPPVVQSPYYLGLRHRSKLPTDPRSPSPRPREPKWVLLNTPLLSKPPAVSDNTGEKTSNEKSSNEKTSNEKTSNEKTSSEKTSTEGKQGSVAVKTETVKTEAVKTETINDRSSWISYEDFICSFNELHVFYNSAVFSNREMYQDLRNTAANSAIPASLSNKKGAAVSSIVISSSKILSGPVALVPVILCDSTESVDITICFSSLSNWLDGQRMSRTKKLPTLGLVPAPVPSSEAAAIGDNEGTTGRFREVLPAGVLLVEPYCWKDMVLKPPALSMSTTAVQTALLSLPPGRHIFRLQVMAPLGYHIELLSDHYFILTNEDAVFVHMSDESKMMVSHSTTVIGNFLEMATTPVTMDKASDTPFSPLQDQVTKMLEIQLDDHEIRTHLYEVFCTSVYYGLCSMQQQLQLTTVMLFAWRAFLHLLYHLMGGATELHMDISTLPPIVRKDAAVPDSWQEREPSSEELSAATKLQAEIRKYLATKISKCLQAGSEEHVNMMEQVSKSAELIAPHREQLGKLVFNTVFQLDQDLFKLFPYYENEQKTRAYHQDYTGSYTDLPLNHWSVLFRETFYVQEPGLMMLPRLTQPPKTSLLRVIDNDNGVEVPRLFQKVIPYYYKPNKTGYTILGEVWSRDDVIDSGEWQLRLVGSSPRLPYRDQSLTTLTTDNANATSTVATAVNITPSLHTQEVMDYYLPDKNGCFLRYLLKVKKNDACAVTVQLKTSKSDAFIKLQILDREESMCSAKGKGHVVLPICWLQPDPVTNAIAEDSEEDNTGKGHKYMVEATIIRDSWPTNESAWSYINILKNVEKLEDGHAGADKPPSGRRQNKQAKGPKAGGGGGRERAGSVMQHRQQIDVSKAHWIMRVVTPSVDAVSCVKDTEKEDELKAMVDAWETKQPGRSKKALESRRKYLEQCKQPYVNEVGGSDNIDPDNPPAALVSDANNAVTFTSLPLPEGPAMVKRVDYSKYMINVGPMPHILQPEEVKQRESLWQQQLMEYRQQRQAVIEKRKEDVQLRNIMKKQQIELAEQWQEELEQSRQKMNEARNALRERFLAVQQKQKEEQAALLATQASVDTAGGRDSKAKGKSAAKGKKK